MRILTAFVLIVVGVPFAAFILVQLMRPSDQLKEGCTKEYGTGFIVCKKGVK